MAFSKQLLERFKEGTLICFTQDFERFPHFTVPQGTLARVTEVNDTAIYALVLTHVPGVSDDSSWHGEVSYQVEDAECDAKNKAPSFAVPVLEPDFIHGTLRTEMPPAAEAPGEIVMCAACGHNDFDVDRESPKVGLHDERGARGERVCCSCGERRCWAFRDPARDLPPSQKPSEPPDRSYAVTFELEVGVPAEDGEEAKQTAAEYLGQIGDEEVIALLQVTGARLKTG